MKVETHGIGTLRLSERMPLLRWGAVVGALLLAATLVFAARTPGGLDPRTRLGGGIVLVLTLALAAFIPDRDFEFDAAKGRMSWSVRRLAYRCRGSIPFGAITSVVVQTDVDTDGRARRISFRLVLMTASGPLPVSSIRTVNRDACERLADQIRALLGHSSRTTEADAAALARAGYVLDAVRLLRRERGLDLRDARDAVARMAKTPALD